MILLSIVLFIALIGVLSYHKKLTHSERYYITGLYRSNGSRQCLELLDAVTRRSGFTTICHHANSPISVFIKSDDNVPESDATDV